MNNLLSDMNKPVRNELMAGLLDKNLEVFAFAKEVYAIYNMHIIPFSQWPEEIFQMIEADMQKHPDAVQVLIELGLEKRLPAIRQYSRCRFGGLDRYADLNSNGESENTEYWDCGFRGQCPYEGRLCSTIKVANGVLSSRELDVIKLLYEGMQAKEISDELGISTTTTPVHIKNILKKTGLRSSAEIVRFASERKIYRIAI